jgi:tetratricopeptide (TPR) repeat protein
MLNSRIKALTVLCGVAFAGGCGSLEPVTGSQSAVVPVAKITNSASVSDPDYLMGRSYQGRRQYDAAIAAYRKSLEVNPGNAEAHNALGVIYASLGKHEQAQTELIAALGLAPSAAHIHNNLGYAYLLRGRSVDAVAALKVATGLDPVNQRSRQNLRAAERALAQNAQPVDAAMLDRIEPMIKSPVVDKNPDPLLPHVISVAPNIFELRQRSSTQLKTGMPSARIHEIVVKVEVANGSGVAGLARRTSSSLQKRGYAVTRLTNQIPYTQVITEIQYRRGEESRANELNALLLEPAKLVESSRLSPLVGVRLLLGRDVGKEMIFSGTLLQSPLTAGNS